MKRRRLGPSYVKLFTAYVVSNVGNGVLLAALPLLAASITRDPLTISGLTAAAGIPWLVVGPLSGTIVDRFDRRRTMVVTEFGRGAIVALGAAYVLAGGGSIWVLYALLILIGIGETLFDPSGLAMVPTMVAPSQLDQANSQLFGSQVLAQRFVGPPLGGWLFALAVWAPLAADTLSFLISAVVVMMLPKGTRAQGSEAPDVGLWSGMMEGVRWVWRDPVLRVFMYGTGALHFSTAAGTSVLVLIAQDRFQLTGFGYGLSLGGLALGYFWGFVIAPSAVRRLPRAKVCVGSVMGAAAGFLLVAASGTAWVAGLGLIVVGLSASQFDLVAISYRQAGVPDRLRGRVMAGFLFVAHGAIPLGAMLGGLVATWAGVTYSYVAAALSIAIVAPLLWPVLKDAELDPERLSGPDAGP